MARRVTGRATHIVARPLEAGGRLLSTGQAVDASAWRNTASLEAQRYLVRIPPASPASSGGLDDDRTLRSDAASGD
jgi:hypothetical protein